MSSGTRFPPESGTLFPDADPNVRQTVEWTVVDGDPRLVKLIEYGRRLGLPEPHSDSFDLRDDQIEVARRG